MLYQIVNGAVKFGADTILEKINFIIKNTEKIAIVGRNGCGKSTLLRLIAGELELTKRDSDEHIYIAKSGNPKIGFLKQMAFDDESITLEEEVDRVFEPIVNLKQRMEDSLANLDKDPSDKNVKEYSRLHDQFELEGGYNYKKDYDMILTKFGFSTEDKAKKLNEFSGGQKTKIAFIKLLLSKPDILLLDEPTNHLDMSTVEWLEQYLASYPKAVVIVSHDRMFLDKVVSVVYEIEYHTAKQYPGNYTDFCQRKKENWEQQMKNHIQQQKEIERLKTLIDRFKNKPTKVAMTRSKLKQIEHMDIIEAPDKYDSKSFHSNFAPKNSGGKEVLTASQLDIGYDSILTQVDVIVTTGQKLGIVGDNGSGKSTFLKTIVDLIPSLGGIYKYGHQIDVGYFDQNSIQYSGNKTVLDEFWEEFPDLTQTEVRSSLGAFLFVQDDVFKTMDMLSGGERARLALCKIFKRRPNFLILDEPTNHMDMISKEALEDILKDYSGTLLFVSHDRYFISQVADSILSFEDSNTKLFPYGYKEYLEYRDQKSIADLEAQSKEEETSKDTSNKPKGKNYHNPLKEQQQKERKIKKLETQMEELDIKIAALKEELLNPVHSTNYQKLQELSEEIEAQEKAHDQLMDQWGSYL